MRASTHPVDNSQVAPVEEEDPGPTVVSPNGKDGWRKA